MRKLAPLFTASNCCGAIEKLLRLARCAHNYFSYYSKYCITQLPPSINYRWSHSFTARFLLTIHSPELWRIAFRWVSMAGFFVSVMKRLIHLYGICRCQHGAAVNHLDEDRDRCETAERKKCQCPDSKMHRDHWESELCLYHFVSKRRNKRAFGVEGSPLWGEDDWTQV